MDNDNNNNIKEDCIKCKYELQCTVKYLGGCLHSKFNNDKLYKDKPFKIISSEYKCKKCNFKWERNGNDSYYATCPNCQGFSGTRISIL